MTMSTRRRGGTRLTRRQALTVAGTVAGAAILAACKGVATAAQTLDPDATPIASGSSATTAVAAPDCVPTVEQEQGPFYVANEQIRQDIIDGKTGAPLQLRITIVDATQCTPIPNAAVDIWHADASGVYSSGSQTFLRGVQLTDADGVAQFTTIYPGWYPGRAIHIHAKVHVGGTVNGAGYTGGHVSHTGQMFFPEEISDQVAQVAAYASRTDQRTLQSQDGVFTGQNGASSVLTLAPLAEGSVADGYLGTITMGVDPTATPAAVGIGGGSGGRGGPGGPGPGGRGAGTPPG